MISKHEPVVAVEGHAYIHGEFLHRRIEISPATRLITKVTGPRGDGDLVLGDDHLIFPGFIDFHVHAREDATGRDNYKETFQSAGEAAIHGGVTAIVDMPNNPKPPVDDASYQEKRKQAANSAVEIFLYAGIGPRTRPLSTPAIYKAYMGPSVGDLFFENDDSLRNALAHYRGQWVSFHAESPEILRRRKDRPTHHERRPPEAEATAVRTSLELARDFNLHPHICHLSTAEGLQAILDARRRGFPATCEVTPHHLMIDLDSLASHPRPGFLQCNPPIRSRADRLALLDAFRRGDIDFLATDHAPHSLEENERGISGIPHLDTFGPCLFWLRDQDVSWSTISRAVSEAPGRALSRIAAHPYGRIEEGFAGSLSILDRSRPVTIRRNRLRTRAGWSPYEGMTFSGSVSHTIVRGKIFPAPPG